MHSQLKLMNLQIVFVLRTKEKNKWNVWNRYDTSINAISYTSISLTSDESRSRKSGKALENYHFVLLEWYTHINVWRFFGCMFIFCWRKKHCRRPWRRNKIKNIEKWTWRIVYKSIVIRQQELMHMSHILYLILYRNEIFYAKIRFAKSQLQCETFFSFDIFIVLIFAVFLPEAKVSFGYDAGCFLL